MTAEDLFHNKYNGIGELGESCKSLMKEFARLKCQELLEIVAEKASVGMSWGYEGGIPDILGSYSKRLKYIVDKDSILNAVDLNEFIR